MHCQARTARPSRPDIRKGSQATSERPAVKDNNSWCDYSTAFGFLLCYTKTSMKKSPLLDQTLCLKFCAYYKTGKKEDLACRGYEVVERLQRSGKTMVFRPSPQKPDLALAELLVQKMCTTCDFHEKDCDFM